MTLVRVGLVLLMAMLPAVAQQLPTPTEQALRDKLQQEIMENIQIRITLAQVLARLNELQKAEKPEQKVEKPSAEHK